jgi:hypothetical protein
MPGEHPQARCSHRGLGGLGIKINQRKPATDCPQAVTGIRRSGQLPEAEGAVALHRTTVEHDRRLAHHVLPVRQDLADRCVRRPVDDHADSSGVIVLDQEHDRTEELGVRECRRGYQQTVRGRR